MSSTNHRPLKISIFQRKLSISITGGTAKDGTQPVMEFVIDEDGELWLTKGFWNKHPGTLERVQTPGYWKLMEWVREYIDAIPDGCSQEQLPEKRIEAKVSW